MKVSREYLKQLIKEETDAVLEEEQVDEGFMDRMKGRASSAWQGTKGKFKSGVAGGLARVAGAAGFSDASQSLRTSQSDIQAQTKSKQLAVKMRQAVLPKLNDMENDLKKMFPKDQDNAVYKAAFEAIEGLKTDLNDLFLKSGMQSPEMKKAEKERVAAELAAEKQRVADVNAPRVSANPSGDTSAGAGE